MEDRVSLSASPWSDVDASEVAALLAGKQFVADELVVAVRSQAGSTTFQDLLAIEGAKDAATAAAIQGATLLGSALSDAATQIYQVTLAAGVDLTGVISAVSKWSNVEWAAPNFVYTHAPQELAPNDPNYSSQWHHATMQTSAAWDITQGSGVIVAVMDDGVDWDHVDLAANIWNNADEIAGNGIDDDANGFVDDVRGWDFSSGDNNPDENGTDSHGTHVAGIIAARTNNAAGVAGVAGQATIMPVRFYGSGDWTSTVIFNSYKYAVDNGAKIINTSYDIDSFVGDSTFDAALNYAYSRGVLMFNSAGNAGQNDPPRQNWDQIIFVASTDSTDHRSSFSNTGSKIDVSAPGSNIISTLPNNTYNSLSGTSMASPAAAAVAALIWAANPMYTRDQVAARLVGTADDLAAMHPGYGDVLGTGRVNALKALTQSPSAPVIEFISSAISVGGTSYLRFDVDSRFDEASIENMSNWELRRDGADNLFGTADDVVMSLTRMTDYMVGSNEIWFSFNSAVVDRYRLTAKSGPSGLKDPFGTQLDGDKNGTAGDDYVLQLYSWADTAPTISPIGPITTNEDIATGPIAFTVTDGQSDAGSLNVTAQVFSRSTFLPDIGLNLVNLGNGNYTLQITPGADDFGTAVIQIVATDGVLSTTQSLDLTVNSVNDAPSFYVGNDIIAPGEQQFMMFPGRVGPISPGADNEGAQQISFLISVDHPELFHVLPQVEDYTKLTFTPKNGAIGVATLSIRMQDNGGTANGGVDTSPPQTLKMTFKAPPQMSIIPDQIVDQGETLSVDFSVSDPDTPVDQIVVTALSPSNPVLLPADRLTVTNLGGGNWRLTATPIAGQFGTAFVRLDAFDGDVWGSASFKLTVNSAVPARVLDVFAGGTSWSTSFKSHLVSKGLSDVSGWFELSRGAGQVDTLPWSNVDQLLLKFSNMPDLTANNIRIIGSADGPALPAIINVYFNQNTQFATISFAAALPPNKFLIYIADTVGNLDGEWIDNTSTASGNGTAGGDFAFRFDVLPGDIDRTKSVSFGEIGQQRLMLGRTTASDDYNYRQDYDGSGSITFSDVGLARGNLGQGISTHAEPIAPVGGTSAGELVGPESLGGPESLDSVSIDTASVDADSSAWSASDPRDVVGLPLVDAAAPVVASTVDMESSSSRFAPLAQPLATPLVTPTGRPVLSEAVLARAWNGLASLPVATVLGREQVAAPAEIRLLAAAARFASLADGRYEPPADEPAVIARRAIIDRAQPPRMLTHWNRLRRTPAAAKPGDSLAGTLADAADTAALVE